MMQNTRFELLDALQRHHVSRIFALPAVHIAKPSAEHAGVFPVYKKPFVELSFEGTRSVAVNDLQSFRVRDGNLFRGDADKGTWLDGES